MTPFQQWKAGLITLATYCELTGSTVLATSR
jgi:hypothetical protein